MLQAGPQQQPAQSDILLAHIQSSIKASKYHEYADDCTRIIKSFISAEEELRAAEKVSTHKYFMLLFVANRDKQKYADWKAHQIQAAAQVKEALLDIMRFQLTNDSLLPPDCEYFFPPNETAVIVAPFATPRPQVHCHSLRLFECHSAHHQSPPPFLFLSFSPAVGGSKESIDAAYCTERFNGQHGEPLHWIGE